MDARFVEWASGILDSERGKVVIGRRRLFLGAKPLAMPRDRRKLRGTEGGYMMMMM